jgi:hypothetical protein
MRNAPRITMIHWEVRKIQLVWDLLAADAADFFLQPNLTLKNFEVWNNHREL